MLGANYKAGSPIIATNHFVYMFATCGLVNLIPTLAAAVFPVSPTQTLLDEGFRSELDVEEVCRAFLDLAKAWSRRLIEMMYSDSGGCDLQGNQVYLHACGHPCIRIDAFMVSTTAACFHVADPRRLSTICVFDCSSMSRARFYAACAIVGLMEQWRKMYSSSEWVSGQTTATILATIGGARW